MHFSNILTFAVFAYSAAAAPAKKPSTDNSPQSLGFDGPFNLQINGADPDLNNTHVVPEVAGNKETYGFSGKTVTNAFFFKDNKIYHQHKNHDGKIIGYLPAFISETENKIPALTFDTCDEDDGFSFDKDGRLALDGWQWGWFACTDSGVDDGCEDEAVLAFWKNQDDADKSRCKPVTIRRMPEVVPL